MGFPSLLEDIIDRFNDSIFPTELPRNRNDRLYQTHEIIQIFFEYYRSGFPKDDISRWSRHRDMLETLATILSPMDRLPESSDQSFALFKDIDCKLAVFFADREMFGPLSERAIKRAHDWTEKLN